MIGVLKSHQINPRRLSGVCATNVKKKHETTFFALNLDFLPSNLSILGCFGPVTEELSCEILRISRMAKLHFVSPQPVCGNIPGCPLHLHAMHFSCLCMSIPGFWWWYWSFLVFLRSVSMIHCPCSNCCCLFICGWLNPKHLCMESSHLQ